MSFILLLGSRDMGVIDVGEFALASCWLWRGLEAVGMGFRDVSIHRRHVAGCKKMGREDYRASYETKMSAEVLRLP